MIQLLIATLICATLPAVGLASERGDVFRHAKAATALILAVNDAAESVSLGSGFFVNADGLLITNAHIIEESQRLYLYVRDRDVYIAPEVVAVDPDLDLAALRIQRPGVDAIELSADISREGTEVLAVGYPRIQDILQMGFALHATISTGTVSGLAEGRSRTKGRQVPFIQTTGVLNFGNSGGPLIDRSGRVIGVNTLRMGGQAQSLGFAVAINHAQALISGRTDAAVASATSSSAPRASSRCSTGSSPTSPTRPRISPGRSCAPGASAPTTGAWAGSCSTVVPWGLRSIEPGAKVKAGEARVETRCLDAQHDKACGNETAFYPPLSRGVAAKPALAVEHAFSGAGFNETWKDTERRGAYVGTFSVR